MTQSPSEVCKLERKVFSPKFASRAGDILKKNHPAGGSKTKVFSRRTYGNTAIFTEIKFFRLNVVLDTKCRMGQFFIQFLWETD